MYLWASYSSADLPVVTSRSGSGLDRSWLHARPSHISCTCLTVLQTCNLPLVMPRHVRLQRHHTIHIPAMRHLTVLKTYLWLHLDTCDCMQGHLTNHVPVMRHLTVLQTYNLPVVMSRPMWLHARPSLTMYLSWGILQFWKPTTYLWLCLDTCDCNAITSSMYLSRGVLKWTNWSVTPSTANLFIKNMYTSSSQNYTFITTHSSENTY